MNEPIAPETAAQMDALLGRVQRAAARLQAVAPPDTGGRYEEALDPAQQAAGVSAALANARDLLTDARLLLGSERWPRAAALAVLSVEECWKAAFLSISPGPLDGSDAGALREFWRDYYRRHTAKSGVAQNFDLFSREFTLQELRSLPRLLGPAAERTKQAGLYSDYRRDAGGARATSPAGEVSEGLARAAVELADASLALISPLEPVMLLSAEHGFVESLGEDAPATLAQLASYFPGIGSMLSIAAELTEQSEGDRRAVGPAGASPKGTVAG